MSNSLISLAAVAGALTLASSPALAQAGNDTPPTRAELKSGLEARFGTIDANKDGVADRAEIEAANRLVAQQTAAGVDRQIEGQFAALDSNKDGQLSLAEFKAAARQPEPTPVDETLQRLDTDKDGKINFDEFGGNMLNAFDQVDANKDGRISDQERQAGRR